MSLVQRFKGATLSWNGNVITPPQLDSPVDGCAAWLCAQGVEAGDRVAVDIAGGIPFAVALTALLRLAATPVPVDGQLTDDERKALLEDLEPKLVLHERLELVRHPHPLVPRGFINSQRERRLPALILYTSGSTGRPKGAVLSQAALEFAIESWAGPVMGLTQDDVVLQVLPLAHSYGLCAGLLAPMLAGARVVMLDRFSPEAVLDTIQRERVTVFPGVATMFRRLMAHSQCSPEALSSVRLVLSGAAPCSDELCARWLCTTGTRITRGYGMTELFRPISYLWTDTEDEPGVVGRPVPGVDVKVENGELLIKSPAAMTGYLNAPEDTAEVLRDGWFCTGDLATLDQRNGVRIHGRKRERILRGGYSVFPSEVEAALLLHPSVQEAVVLGQPHPELGEEVMAFVVLHEDRAANPQELVEFCRGRLAAFKYPRQVVLLPRLPRSSSGKVLKSQLLR